MQIDAQVEQGIEFDAGISESEVPWIDQFSAADGLYLLVLVGAAIMRFTGLGDIPLSPVEAGEALAAWQVLQPGSEAVVISSPAYFTLTSLLMPIVGDSDAVMRLIPAVFGFGLVFLPWYLRGRLGAVGVLVCASLLAASPLNGAVSRMVGGDAIAAFAILLVAVAVLRQNKQEDSGWFYILAVALGLGLSSSPLFYSGVISFALALLIASFTTKESLGIALPERQVIIKGIILAAIILTGLSTRILTYPAGFGASAQLLGSWLGQFNLGGLQEALAPFLVLTRYEIALLILGTVAIFWVAWRSSKLGTLLVLWTLLLFMLILVQSGVLVNALLATLPGYLLVGLVAGFLFRQRVDPWTWALGAALLLIGAILFVNVGRYLRISLYEQNLSNLWLALLALAAAALLVYYFWTMTNASITQGLWLSALLVLLVFEWGTAWHLTHYAANDPREQLVTEATDDDLPLLLRTLEDVSRQATNSDNELGLLSAVDTPVLGWYLRDFRQATIGQSVPPGAQHQAILTLARDGDPSFGATYTGSDFGLLRTGTTTPVESATPIADLLRWWLFHEAAVIPIEDRVVLWVRTDLVLPQQ